MAPLLRLNNSRVVVEFNWNHSTFRVALLNAFNRHLVSGGDGGVFLEVKHKIHGWIGVCFEGSYVSIRSPIHLDFVSLRNGVYQTLQQADTWPTESQKAIKKQEAIKREMEEEAARRRNRFFVVH